MSRWFRMYSKAMRDPKVMRLSDSDFRLWVSLLAVAAENNGLIPPLDDLKHLLNRRLDHLSTAIKRLVNVALIDPLKNGYEPHNWAKFQYVSDNSTERVKRYRNAKAAVTETPPDNRDRITDTEDTPQTPLCDEAANGNGRQAGQDLAYELAGMVGLVLATPSAITTNVNAVEAWLHDGIAPDTCREVIRNCVANGGAKDTRSLKRFDAVIRHDHAKRNPGAPEPPKPPPPAEQIRMFEAQAARMERLGNAEAAAEFLSKAERLRASTLAVGNLQQRMREVAARATGTAQ